MERRGEDPEWLKDCRALADMPVDEFNDYIDTLDDDTFLQTLRMRFRIRIDEWIAYQIPWIAYAPWCDYHLEAMAPVPISSVDRRNAKRTIRDAHAAPRGVAKSTLAKAMVLHRIAYGLEGMVVIIAPNLNPEGYEWVRTLRSWLAEASPRFVRMHGFPVVEGPKSRFVAKVGDLPQVNVVVRSLKTAVRGLNFGSVRPTLVVLDDIEDAREVRNVKIRNLWQSFLNDDVLKLGGSEGGLEVWYRGTVLHPDSILARILEGKPPNAGWRAKKWKAVIEWPTNMDLWARCKTIYTDLTKGFSADVREEAAKAFYAKNQAAMDAGAVVLDPHRRDLFSCFRTMWDEGEAAFNRELQNTPHDPTQQVFYSEKFARCDVFRDSDGWKIRTAPNERGVRRVLLLSDLRTTLRWDPALGGAGGDYAAIVVMARDDLGFSYVVAVWMERNAGPTRQLAALWGLAETFLLERGTMENNGFQALLTVDFKRDRENRQADGKWADFQLKGDASTVNKEARIMSMEIPVNNGYLQFANNLPAAYMQQWDDFTPDGGATHDDGPDATEGAYTRLGGSVPKMVESGKRD